MISKSIIFSKYLVNNIYPTLAKVPFSLRSSQPSRHISRRSKSNIVNHLALDSLQIWKPKWYPDLALMCLIDSANIAAFTNQYGSFNFIQFSFRCGVSLPAFAVSSRYFALSSSTHLRWVSFGRVSLWRYHFWMSNIIGIFVYHRVKSYYQVTYGGEYRRKTVMKPILHFINGQQCGL